MVLCILRVVLPAIGYYVHINVLGAQKVVGIREKYINKIY